MLLCALRTVLFYTILLIAIRLLGKRQLGQMEPSEFVVTMLLANLATIPIEGLDVSIVFGLLPIALVFGAEYLMSVLTLKSIRVRRIFCGKPVILIENGVISQRNLRRTRLTLDELTMHLREKDVFDLSTVKFAILETNGQLSTLLYAKDTPPTAKDAGISVCETALPITLISDGRLLKKNLKLAGKDEAWLAAELANRHVNLSQVLLLTLDSRGRIYFARQGE